MAALSATVVQKALKVEATTIYARLSLNTAGTTATVITGSVAGGNPGASKGVNTTDTAYVAGQGYKIYLDSSIPVNQFLGAPSAILKNGNVAAADVSYLTRVYATGKDTIGSYVTIATSAVGAPQTPVAAASSAGQELWVTIPFTTSNVW